jgi:hypothetical protein
MEPRPFGVAVLCVLLAGCSWSLGTARVVDGQAGEPIIRAAVAPSTVEGELKVVVRGIVSVPPEGSVDLRESDVERYVPWNPVEKLTALPIGIACLGITPVALVIGLVGAPFGAEFGDKNVPLIMLPLLTLSGGGACLADFAWFFQPLPDLSWHASNRDELPLRRTGSGGVVRYDGLHPGDASVPAQALPVRLTFADGTETGFRVTDEQGEVRFRVSPGCIEVGRQVTVTLRLPDEERSCETTIEALGAELTGFPPDLQSGR